MKSLHDYALYESYLSTSAPEPSGRSRRAPRRRSRSLACLHGPPTFVPATCLGLPRNPDPTPATASPTPKGSGEISPEDAASIRQVEANLARLLGPAR
jgi:hypothetical protein